MHVSRVPFGAVSASDHLTRPGTPEGFDASRAAERAADPQGWRYDDAQRAAVRRVIAERRDIRRFRPDPVPDAVLRQVLEAAHQAPSVGLMQPWRLIVVSDPSRRGAVRRLAQRERLRQAERFDARTRHFLDQKVEGIVEAPLGIVVCCDHGPPDAEILGRGTIPKTDVYSTACAIQNLWLAARAEGLGVGWVSFYRPDDLRALLAIPARVDPIAYLCLGWPDERPARPGLETAGWSSRMPLEDVVMRETWEERDVAPAANRFAPARAESRRPADAPDGHRADASDSQPADASAGGPADGPDREAATATRDRADRLIKPAGSLGALETVVERWASITGAPPPRSLRAGVLICAADHGHTARGTSLFGAEVTAQVTAAAARGESAVGVLARRGGHPLVVADVGLACATPDGVRAAKVAAGTRDMVDGPALTDAQLDAALAAGATLATELAEAGVDCLVLGEIGIGNTATTAALVSALTGAAPELTVGRGTGMDAAGLERKRGVVTAALKRHGSWLAVREALLAVGGLELAALTGAILEAARRRLPVVLDGYATGASALAALRLDAFAGEILFAGHRSAEPGHDLVLAELGLEPLLDLRLRLGEGSGALLALPTLAAAGALHRDMATFAESGVSGPR